jgi:hypothetical protein
MADQSIKNGPKYLLVNRKGISISTPKPLTPAGRNLA